MESKYVNQSTLNYLQAQTGQTTQQRLQAIEGTIHNITTYLEQQQKFLADYEAYLEAEIAKKASLVDVVEGAKATANIADNLSSRIRISFYLALTGIGLVIGLATAYFLK